MDAKARELLAHIARRLEEISDVQHELHRKRERLRHAATQLRLGEAPEVVMARLAASEALVA